MTDPSAPSVKRLNVNINDETAAALKDLAQRQGMSVTEVVRRAAGVYKFLNDELRDGHTLQLVDNETKERTTIAML